jgi:hypothetical protein
MMQLRPGTPVEAPVPRKAKEPLMGSPILIRLVVMGSKLWEPGCWRRWRVTGRSQMDVVVPRSNGKSLTLLIWKTSRQTG